MSQSPSFLPPIPPIPPMPDLQNWFGSRPDAPFPMSQAEIAAIVAQITYKHGWQLSAQFERDLILFRMDAPIKDRDTGRDGMLTLCRAWPRWAIKNEQVLLWNCMQALMEMEVHEAQEMFRYKGQLIFDPHAAEGL